MTKSLLLIAAAFLGLTLQAPPPPSPQHGPYYGQNVICYRGETALDAKPKGRVHCDCKAPCDNDGMEDRACQTYCGVGEQCLCHTDECEAR